MKTMKEEIIAILYQTAKRTETDKGIQVTRIFSDEADAIIKYFDNRDKSINIDPKVRMMAEFMQFKLDKNKRKNCSIMNPNGTERKWDDCDVRWLLMRLREEADEIENALNDNESPIEVAKECADVCNFAMMLADNIGGLKESHTLPKQ